MESSYSTAQHHSSWNHSTERRHRRTALTGTECRAQIRSHRTNLAPAGGAYVAEVQRVEIGGERSVGGEQTQRKQKNEAKAERFDADDAPELWRVGQSACSFIYMEAERERR